MQVFTKTKWFDANRICMAQGSSTGSVQFFETEKDHERLLQLWDKYLGAMTELIQYSFTSTNWMILFRSKSSKSINAAYSALRVKSIKADLSKTLHQPSRMLSEHFRIMLSQYVRQTNMQVGRRGTRVRQRFDKFLVNQLVDYKAIFERIHLGIHTLLQPNPLYQAKRKSDNTVDQLKNWSIWRSSRLYYMFTHKKHRVVDSFRIINPDSYILRKILAKQKMNISIRDS